MSILTDRRCISKKVYVYPFKILEYSNMLNIYMVAIEVNLFDKRTGIVQF